MFFCPSAPPRAEARFYPPCLHCSTRKYPRKVRNFFFTTVFTSAVKFIFVESCLPLLLCMWMFQVFLKYTHIDCRRKRDLSQTRVKSKNGVSRSAIFAWTLQAPSTFSCSSDLALQLLLMST